LIEIIKIIRNIDNLVIHLQTFKQQINMKKTIQKLEQSIYKGGVSYKVAFADGESGLLTNSTLVKEFGGNLPETWKIGNEVDAIVEVVTKPDGSGQWTSIKPDNGQAPQQAYQAPQASGAAVSVPSKGSTWTGEDRFSKMINTAMICASNFYAEKDTVNDYKVVMNAFVDFYAIMLSSYNESK